MKYLILLFVLMSSLSMQSQVSKEASIEVFKNNEVDFKAEPKGGIELFYKDLVNAVELSDVTADKIDFRISFIVEKDGSLSTFEITGADYEYGKKVVEHLKSQPKWKPASIKKDVVRTQVYLPIKITDNRKV